MILCSTSPNNCLISRSKQNCKSLTYLASHCDETLLRTGKVSVTTSNVRSTEENVFRPRKRPKILRSGEKFIDIRKCTKTLSLLNTLKLRYLRKVKRICSEFLADMSNDLPYILCCDWNFSPRVNKWRATGLDVSTMYEDAKRFLVLLLCDWAKKTKVFWHQSEARTAPTVWNWSVKTLSPALLRLLDFSLPDFFSRPFRLFPGPTNCPWVSENELFLHFDWFSPMIY